jgi:toxin YoeB
MYRIVLSEKAQKDYSDWVSSGNRGIVKKIAELLEDIVAHPFSGIGKPECLKYDLSGYWSRRINATHRVVYTVNEAMQEVYVLALKYHYSKKE